MVAVHTVLYLCRPESLGGFDPSFGSKTCYLIIDNILGATLSAPVFMFCMGVGFAYTRASDSLSYAKRGGGLLVKGIVLNLVRGGMFGLVLLLATQTDAMRENTRDAFIFELFQIDILPFAGLAFLVMAVLKKAKFGWRGTLFAALVMLAIGARYRFLALGSFAKDLPLMPFVGVADGNLESCFPLFNWFIFPAAGYAFAQLLRRCTDMNRLFAILTPISLAIYLPLTVYLWRIESPMLYDEPTFYHMDFTLVAYTMVGICSMLGVSYYLSRILTSGVMRFAGEASRNINKIYIVHWLILIALSAVTCHTFDIWFGVYASQVAAAVVFALAFFVVRGEIRWRDRRK